MRRTVSEVFRSFDTSFYAKIQYEPAKGYLLSVVTTRKNTFFRCTKMNSGLLLVFIVLSSLEAAAPMGYTNIFAIVRDKLNEESIHQEKLLKDAPSSTQRSAFLPNGAPRLPTTELEQKGRRGRKISHFATTVKNMQSYSSQDEEILERLIELQD